VVKVVKRMADTGDQPSRSDGDLDKSESKVATNSKQRLAKQAEVEDVEEVESSRIAAAGRSERVQTASEDPRSSASQSEVSQAAATRQCEGSAVAAADNGEDQSPNSDESDRTVVDTGQQA